ncbi:hypothetical protein DL96DRAFT_1608081 [Flagelloscypha sp. PMI_526]|nr:hypothetical protein DL96DRAFT_1608081 [Flagelloscypha sp. PMI_526]
MSSTILPVLAWAAFSLSSLKHLSIQLNKPLTSIADFTNKCSYRSIGSPRIRTRLENFWKPPFSTSFHRILSTVHWLRRTRTQNAAR